MKAIVINELGPYHGSLFYRTNVTRPKIKAGQLLIRVKASCVQPFDLYLVAGMFPGVSAGDVPGLEGCGIVEESQHAEFHAGQPVIFAGNGFGVHGAWAEYVTLSPDCDLVVSIPSHSKASTESLATVPTSFLTASRALELAKCEEGKSVLVTNGTGAVGNAVIQLARLQGASTVIALARTSNKAAQLIESAAVDVIDLSQEAVGDGVARLTEGQGVDCVIDLISGDIASRSIAAMAPWGTTVLVGAASGEMEIRLDFRDLDLKSKSVRGFSLYPDMQRNRARHLATLSNLCKLIADGKLLARVAVSFQLRDVVKACAVVEQGLKHVGKVAIKV